jgi:hypothetical protein
MTTRVTLGSSAPLVPTTEFSISGTVTAGDAVYQVSGADNTVARADASDAGKRPPIGIVQSVSGGSCVVALNGEVATSLSGLTRGTVYWLGTVPGQLVDTKPASNSYPLGIAVSATELRIDTVAYGINIAGGSGTVTSAGITSADLTVSNSPITTSGVIDLALNTVPVSKGGTGLTSAVEQGASLIASSSSAYVAQATSLSWRNRIINGDMRVAQRGTAAQTVSGSVYPVDRFYAYKAPGWTGLVVTSQQSTDAPAGFTNSLLYTIATGSNTAGYNAIIGTALEGNSIFDLSWGSSGAKTITWSFWAKSSLTGTYSVSLQNKDQSRSYVTTFNIDSSGQWEKKIITIPGDQSGVWATDNSVGIYLQSVFKTTSSATIAPSLNTWLAGNYAISSATQTLNFPSTTGRTFQITGVQLELGSVATPFELLQFEKQLELCQRYFARLSSLSGNYVGFGAGCSTTTTNALAYIKYPQAMRGTPTISQSSTAILNTSLRSVTALSTANYGNNSMALNITTASATQTIGQGIVWCGNNSAAAYIDLNAEL